MSAFPSHLNELSEKLLLRLILQDWLPSTFMVLEHIVESQKVWISIKMTFEVGPDFNLKIAQAKHRVVYELRNELRELLVSLFSENWIIA